MIREIPIPVYDGVYELLNARYSLPELIKFSFTGGGCINHGGRLETSQGSFFLKWNDAEKFPGMFEAEAKGLTLLQQANATHIPAVIGKGVRGSLQFLLMEFIDQKARSKNYWRQLGEQLAGIHKVSSETYGLDHNNYIGSLHQYNPCKTSWLEFFVNERLEIQLKLAESSGIVNTTMRKRFEELYNRLPSLLPEEKPSLLHGDLWSGNLMVNQKGDPCLIDPAVYFGHREADLAMTNLFGGFSHDFYESYHQVFPLQPGYRNRFDLYNLYPLLVHMNLFGEGYLRQVNSIVAHYTN